MSHSNIEKPSAVAPASLKLPPRALPFAFAFFMAGIMAFLMCCVIVVSSSGFGGDLMARVMHAYVVAMPVAFICVLIVRPIAMRLTMLVVRAPGS